MRSFLLALVFALAVWDTQADRTDARAPEPHVVTEALPCLNLDSLTADQLWYADAVLGMRGTSGGTRLTVSPDTSGWVASLEPIWSDFPNEPNDWQWPRRAHALTVSWTDVATGRVRFRRVETPKGTDGDGQPYDTVLAESWADSITAMLRCDGVVLMRWDGSKLDTVTLERRQGPGH